jgi:hypothetical protein
MQAGVSGDGSALTIGGRWLAPCYTAWFARLALAQPFIYRTKTPLDVANIDARGALQRAAERLKHIAQALRAMGISRAADDIQATALELDRLSRSCICATRDTSSGGAHETDVEP